MQPGTGSAPDCYPSPGPGFSPQTVHLWAICHPPRIAPETLGSSAYSCSSRGTSMLFCMEPFPAPRACDVITSTPGIGSNRTIYPVLLGPHRPRRKGCYGMSPSGSPAAWRPSRTHSSKDCSGTCFVPKPAAPQRGGILTLSLKRQPWSPSLLPWTLLIDLALMWCCVQFTIQMGKLRPNMFWRVEGAGWLAGLSILPLLACPWLCSPGSP